MPVIALDVISRVRAASISSGDGSGTSLIPFWPGISWGLLPMGPPFMPGLLPRPIPGGICWGCCATIAVTLIRIGRRRTMTRDWRWGNASRYKLISNRIQDIIEGYLRRTSPLQRVVACLAH